MKWLLMLVWLAASSCTVQDTGKVKLRFWAMGAEGEKVKPLIEKFQQEYPDIEVAVQAIPWGAAYEKLLTAYAGQALPDVLQLGNTWIPQFASLEAILPLDAYIAGSAVVYPEAYFEGIWNTNIIGEKVYGVPWYVDTRLLFYRSDILADAGYPNPPQTWDEWKDVSRAIVAKTDSKYAAFFSLIFNDWQIPVILILSNGGKILRDNFQYGAFDDPRTLEALSFYIDFFRQGLVPRTMTEFANIYQGFERGDMAMMITGPWNIAEMRLRAPELAGRWTTAPMPVKESRNSVAGGASLVISSGCPNPEQAWKLVEFMARPDIQKTFFELTNDMPSVKAAWEAPQLQEDREARAFFEQLTAVAPTPPIAEWERIAVKIQEHMERVVYGQLSLEEGVKNLNKDVDRILEKRRWLLSKGLL
ncbi:MAG TPA: sugar ABC transporter substrate-binding protein [Calditrichia bacterium]|nr:sugar ABC transporter substrate-binding protein [Calditrichota bacterium]HQU70700.1 sugar ABC transporter substrate-binding protein [Calditrichia bacterium]HQV32902.1 sugar ABC transporter substrate-binding protein [Calditrichia bacterium]